MMRSVLKIILVASVTIVQGEYKGEDIVDEVAIKHLKHWCKPPKWIATQRHKNKYAMRMGPPPHLRQFNAAVDKEEANKLFKLLQKYSPAEGATNFKSLKSFLKSGSVEDKKEPEESPEMPTTLVSGIEKVMDMVAARKAKLVVIARETEFGIEGIVCLPDLCKKFGIPYVIVKNQNRLAGLLPKKGGWAEQKKAACVALASVKEEDQSFVDNIVNNFQIAREAAMQERIKEPTMV